MMKIPLLGLPAVAVAVTASTCFAGTVGYDQLTINFNGHNVVSFKATDETQESFHSRFLVQNLPASTSTIFLTEPKTEPDYQDSIIKTLGGRDVSDLGVSDALSIFSSGIAGQTVVDFISDGASASDLASFPIWELDPMTIEETGDLQPVGAFFDLPADDVLVGSDVVPEPGSFGLLSTAMLVIFGGRIAIGRSARRR